MEYIQPSPVMANNQIWDKYPRGSHNQGKQSVTHSLFRLYLQSQNKTKKKSIQKREKIYMEEEAMCMKKRENGEHTKMKEIFKGMFPLPCVSWALRLHSLLIIKVFPPLGYLCTHPNQI